MKKRTSEWLEQARVDLRAAEMLVKNGDHWTPLFHLQQSIETLLKALLLEETGHFPESHNLRELAKAAGVLDEMKESDVDLLRRLDTYYMGVRYPDSRPKLKEEITPDHAGEELRSTREVFNWLSSRLR